MRPHPQLDSLRVDFSGAREDALAQAQAVYAEWGCVVATRFFAPGETEVIREEIRALIALALGEPADPAAPFDAGYPELLQRDPEAAGAVFAACRRLTSVHQLSVAPALLQLSQRLMGTTLVMSSPYKPMRIDCAQRADYLLPWHQDYPYAQDSIDSIVYWIPMQDVDQRNGCLLIAPGSHKLGVLPVVMTPAGEAGIRGLRLADPSIVQRLPQLAVPMRQDDALVFNSLLLHSSQPNHTQMLRWTLQVRHGNFAQPLAVRKRWPRGHYERHWFDETHPESVVTE